MAFFRVIRRFGSVILFAGILSFPTVSVAALGPEGRPSSETAASDFKGSSADGSITVTGTDGEPVPGVTLLVQARPVVLLPEKLAETTSSITNAAGRLADPVHEVQGVYFLLKKTGFETLALDASRPLPRQVPMRPGRRISGAVFSPDGQPISGAIVGPVIPLRKSERDHTTKLFPRVSLRTAADGSFALDGMPLQPVQIQFAAPGYAARLISFPVGQNEQKVALTSGGANVKGTVLGSKDRAPQPQIPVEASGNGLTVSTVTDGQGIYILDNLSTGTWAIRPASGGPLSGTQSRPAVVDVAVPDQTLDVPLVLNQGVMLAGRAVDAATSAGLGGINITLAGYAGAGAKAVLTDPDGSFRFENLDSMQDVIIRFDPVKFVYLLPDGAYRDYFDISKVSDTNFDVTTLTLPLFRRLPVQGDVVDVAGKAVPDVEVRMQALEVLATARTKAGRDLLSFSTKSNGDGKFQAGVYPPGRYKVWAQQSALVSQVEQVDIFTTAAVPMLKLKLNQAAELEGIVTDAHDKPVTGAVVIAWPANAPEPAETPIPGRESYIFTKSGKDGKFRLSGLRGEPLMMRATHPDFFQPVKAPFDPKTALAGATGQTTSAVALKFPAGGEFSITVTDDAGSPLSQAEVAVEFREGLDGHRASVITDRFGKATGASIPANKLDRVTVSHPMFSTYKQDGPIPLPVNGITISLKKRPSLTATVKGESLVPNVAPEVYLLHAPLSPGGSPPADSSYEKANQAQVVAGQAVFRSLPEGWYKVVFADSGAYAESDAAKIESGSQDQTVELTLPKGNHLLGVVTDKTSGKPVAGANVTLHPAIQSDIIAERATQNTTTQQDGSFELYNVGAGNLHIKVIAANYPDYEKTVSFSPEDTLHVELSNEPAQLTGKVTVGGAPVEGALLILASGHGAGGAPLATATTDASGQYRMEDLSAGNFALSVEAPIGHGDNIARKTVAVELQGGEATKDVEFAQLVNVTGHVKLDGKIPSRDSGDPITILFRGTQPGLEAKMITLEPDGTYSVQLEPGDYQASLEDREGSAVTVQPGASQTLDLSF